MYPVKKFCYSKDALGSTFLATCFKGCVNLPLNLLRKDSIYFPVLATRLKDLVIRSLCRSSWTAPTSPT